uniref:Sporulation protein SpoOM n=1 Tax=uncultured Armatimonadetes bacterium TaxID=157466 RepID=A0A6J4HZD3_9BACT|nr:Sporulation protein SpoOM [uncultured Armatimonadetes bacterium]
MGFLSKVGAAVGIGGAEVSVSLDKDAYRWNDTITGTVHVQGGEAEQDASEIRVEVVEHWITTSTDSDGHQTENHHYQRYNAKPLATQVKLMPRAPLQYPFEIQAPYGVDFSRHWYVEARVSVPRAVDRHGTGDFSFLPPQAIEALGRALVAVAPFSSSAQGNSKSEVHLDYAPPENLKDRLDGVKLTASETADQVTGTLEINPQEKGIGDHLKALFRKDRVRHPFAFPRDTLFHSLDGPPPPEVVAKLRELLQPYVG